MINIVPILLAISLTTGCAFTVHDVNVDYQYDKPVSSDLSFANIEVGDFSDTRDVENPRMIMHMKNGYGQTTSGGWQAEKPINEILRDAVIDGLGDAGANLMTSGGNLLLSGELLEVEGEIIMGAWVGSYKGKVSAKFQVKNNSTGKIIWRDTFIGSGEVKGGKGSGPETSLKVALDDLVTDLLNDEYFLSKLSEGE